MILKYNALTYVMDNLDWQILTDLTETEYQNLRLKFYDKGQSDNYTTAVLGRSILPNIRNLYRPPGEIYAPIEYCEDYIIKLINKPAWGGHIIAITLWNMLVIDVDQTDEDMLPYIERSISKNYPNDLFYINKTHRGYHIYLISRPLAHYSKAAIYMRKKLFSDPAHGTNSLYNGCSIRLSRKVNDLQGLPSIKLKECGNGKPDTALLKLYNFVQKEIATYGLHQINVDDYELIKSLQDRWDAIPNDFGKVHVIASAPYLLTDNVYTPNPSYIKRSPYLQHISSKYWSQFIKYRTIKPERIPILLMKTQESMGMNNLYRIFQATQDYAVGIHVQENCHFISYKDLLMIDYDHRSRLAILKRYTQKNPSVFFRIVKTKKGYHCFLTSHRVNHRDGMDLLRKLYSDPMHIVGVYHRGYSVRINKKYIREQPYKEIRSMGTGAEDSELYQLYLMHLDLYKQNAKTSIYQYQRNASKSIYRKDGPGLV